MHPLISYTSHCQRSWFRFLYICLPNHSGLRIIVLDMGRVGPAKVLILRGMGVPDQGSIVFDLLPFIGSGLAARVFISSFI